MGQMSGKPHHFSTSLFKVQRLLVLCQCIEACLQTVVEHNPWFPDEGSFDLEIWHWVKFLNEPPGRERTFQLISGPYGGLIKAVILPFQGNSSPHDI